MDDFKLIYEMLKYIRESMKYEEFDVENFNAKTFNVTETEFFLVLRTLQQEAYINDVECITYMCRHQINIPVRPTLTIKGMEYLAKMNETKNKKDVNQQIDEHCQAIGELLRKYYTPHDEIIITSQYYKLVSEERGAPITPNYSLEY